MAVAISLSPLTAAFRELRVLALLAAASSASVCAVMMRGPAGTVFRPRLTLVADPTRGTFMSVNRGLLVILEAKPGKADELGAFLAKAQPLAVAEPGTITWYAFKLSDTTYGIFDTFPDENARQAHLNGPIAAALGQSGPGLLAKDPEIRMTDILAAK